MNDFEKAQVRQWCVFHARKINPRKDCDKILEDAKKLAQFLVDEKTADVLSLVKKDERTP